MPDIDPNDPSTTSSAYDLMSPLWDKINTLLGGTEAMRAAGTKFTSQHDKEGDESYNERLHASVLLNMLEFTLDGWVSKPFDLPLRLGDDVPDEIRQLADDIDLQGNSLDVFARNWFRDGMAKGFSHVLVEFPRPDPLPDGQPRTLANDRADNLRPYLVHIKPENLIFAYAEIVNGVERLTHVRIREEIKQMVGFAEQTVCRIRVIEPGFVTIYEEQVDKRNNDAPIWVPVDQYEYNLPFIPLVTFYAKREGLMLGKPPLADLADLNIRHFNSTADQISVLTVARFPIICASGAQPEDTSMIIGPKRFLHNPDPNGHFYYLEHTGAAIGAGRQELIDLEETMAQFGATFLRRRAGGASATARALDSAETSSPLSDMAIRFRDALEQAMFLFAQWLGLDDGGTYTITTDFGLSDEGGIRLQAILAARAARELSHQSYIAELLRYNVLGVEFDVVQNDAEIQAEPAPVGPPAQPPTIRPQNPQATSVPAM
jgi:hypothetical protein